MLKSLSVINFALIEYAAIEFSHGLNIISGETGAGKSIFIDALNCVLGERASIDNIRSGQDFFRIEAVFDISGETDLLEKLDELAIPVEDESNLILTRKVTRSGKNSTLINGCQVQLGFLRQITGHLVDIHGQHESQSLLQPENYILLLDKQDSVLSEMLSAYQTTFSAWQSVHKELAELETSSQERERRLDMLAWQVNEIAAAGLKPDEDSELEQQIKILANGEKIANAVNRAYALINGSQDHCITAQLAEVKHSLEQAVRFDPALNDQLSITADALYQLEEAGHELKRYLQETTVDPNQLAYYQTRMDLIYKLKKKYGTTIAEIQNYYQVIQTEIEQISTRDQSLNLLKQNIHDLEAKLSKLAEKLDRRRLEIAKQLGSEITTHLQSMAMQGAKFSVRVEKTEQYNTRGKNQVLFEFSANPGEEVRPLFKVASGGELSRIALAIKTVLSESDHHETMVFDELDTGIGGRTALMVAEKIALLAAKKQILCITHLAQIAVMSDIHIYIEKISDSKHAQTTVTQLNEKQRIREISRMLSGSEDLKSSMENAANMLKEAERIKEKWKK